MTGLVLGLWLAASAPASAAPTPPDVTAVVHRFYDVLNAGKVSGLDEVMADGVVDHSPDPKQGPGREGFEKAIAAMYLVFPDIHITVEDLVVQGDKAMARVKVTGTQKRPFFTVPSFGHKFAIDGYDEFRIENGKIVERWGLWDVATMFAQLAPAARSKP